MNKICKIHGSAPRVKRTDGGTRCKKCRSEAVARRRRLLKLKAIKYKGGACSMCGYNKCAAALSFHHLDPSQKDFGISKEGNTRSWEKVKIELDKCLLICQNCHAEVHEAEFKFNHPELNARLDNFNPIIKTPHKPKHKKKQLIKHTCSICNQSINKQSKYCLSCYGKNRKTKIQWPDTQTLIKMVKLSSYVKVAKKLGVSDNAIRKRIKNHS